MAAGLFSNYIESPAPLAAYPGMQPLALLLLLAGLAVAQDYVRPWVVAPPKKTAPAPTLQLPPAPAVPVPAPPDGPALSQQPAGFPLPTVLAPCTWFPGNPVFIIEGDKVTMRKVRYR
jgi:hypothetical protein